MKVSCICPTYNRVAGFKHLLEEAVESFIRQIIVFPLGFELIIINDHPGQQIVLDHPFVRQGLIRIINHPTRFDTLGEKYNYAIEQAAGELICPWEDDDISLPHRLWISLGKIQDADYFNPKAYFFLCSGQPIKFEQMTGYAHNCSIFRKSAWKKVGGYPHVSGPQDAAMDGLLRSQTKTIDGPLSREDCFFIYRWGVSNLHLSGYPDTEKVYKDYSAQATKQGTYTLSPHWDQDYSKLTSKID